MMHNEARLACGSASPDQRETNETITKLWLCYSVKNAIRKHVAIPKHTTHYRNDLMTMIDTLTLTA